MADFDIDYSVLEASELFKTTSYVPVCTPRSVKNNNPVCKGKKVGDVIGKSGTTVGVGVDLGQMNEYELHQLKLPIHLFLLLKPYLGVKGNKALELDQVDLMLNDAKILSERVKDVTINKIARQYEHDSHKKFSLLSKNIQTAIADYFFQYGPNSMKSPHHSNLWSFIVKGEWKQAAQFLSAESNYPKRRTVEAKLILESPEVQKNGVGTNQSFKLP